MRYLGIDFGSKRIGLAISDESQTIAVPKEVIRNDKDTIEYVLKYIKGNDIQSVVLGESKDFNGNDNKIMDKILEFKSILEKNDIEVIFEREYLTSAHVEGDKDKLDASSASLILQRYLDRKKYGNNR